MASQEVTLPCRGLKTAGNPYLQSPGAMAEFTNMMLNRDNIAQSRRGTTRKAVRGGSFTKLFTYDDYLIAAWGTNTISRSNDGAGTWTNFAQAITPPNGLGWRIMSAEANRNLYLTGNDGIYRLSGATAAIYPAGAPPGLCASGNKIHPTAAIGGLSRTAGIVTATTSSAHGFLAGVVVNITGTVDPDFANGQFTVLTVPSSTTFTYAEAGAEVVSAQAKIFNESDMVGGANGWLAYDKHANYRIVFSTKDARGTTHFGAPSGAFTIFNNESTAVGASSGVAQNTQILVALPSEITTSAQTFFVQLYRSAGVASTVTPSDNMRLVYEAPVMARDKTAKRMFIVDIVPDALRGALIYTAESEEGLAQSNEPLPLAYDLAYWKECLWLAKITSRFGFRFSILAVGGTNGIAVGESIVIDGTTYTAVDQNASSCGNDQFSVAATGMTATQQIRNTAQSLVTSINRSSTNTSVYAFYDSKETDLDQGKVRIRQRALGGAQFLVGLTAGSKRRCYNPVMPPTVHVANLSRTGTTVTATMVSGNASFLVGEKIRLAATSGDFIAGDYDVTATPTATTFMFTQGSGSATASGCSFTTVDGTAGQSSNDDFKNGLAFSKPRQPEAVPPTNFFRIGLENFDVLRVIPTEDTLWVIKEDGLFAVTGNDASDFVVRPVDPGLHFIARECAAPCLGFVFALAKEGWVRASEGEGAVIISHDIDPTLQAMLLADTVATWNTDSFAFGYDADGYYVCGRTSKNDNACDTFYAYHVPTRSWSLWSFPSADDGKRHAVVHRTDQKIYWCDAYGGDGFDSYAYQERKTGAASDYRDNLGDDTNVGISHALTWVVRTAGDPSELKAFTECQVFFDTSQPTVSLTYQGEQGGGYEGGSHVAQGYLTIRDWVRSNARRCAKLRVRLTHSTIDEALLISGIALSYERLGNVVGK